MFLVIIKYKQYYNIKFQFYVILNGSNPLESDVIGKRGKHYITLITERSVLMSVSSIK